MIIKSADLKTKFYIYTNDINLAVLEDSDILTLYGTGYILKFNWITPVEDSILLTKSVFEQLITALDVSY